MNLQLEVHHPKGHANAPLVILTAGFLLDSTLYRSYAEDLASWGYSVVLWDLSELFDDASTVRHMRSIIDSCTSDPRLSRYVDTGSIYLVGHSRGAKLSVLLAAQDVRVKGLCLLDPVDVTSMTPQGPGWGTCLPALRQITQPQGRCVPVLVVGAALNTDVVPPEGNYKKFVDACQGPCWGLTLKGASHLQFLDRQVGLLSIFSAEGPTPSAVVRRISKAAAAAWGHATATPHITTTIEPDVERLLRQEAAALGGLADIESRLWNMQFVGQSGRGAYMNMDSGSAEQATRSSRGTDQPPGARSRSTWSRSAAPPGPDKVWGPTAGASSTDTSSSTSTSTGSSSSNSNSNSYSTSNSSSSSNGNSTGPGSTAAPITDSYEMLLRRRAKELKQMLVERGVDCSDCFEKEDLARRILERCR